MDLDTLKALIPAIPGMLTAGISVWNNMVKPLLIKIGYNITKELEREMLVLEENKDIKAFTEKIEGIYGELSQTAIIQNQNGKNNLQIGNNTAPIDNSTKYYFGAEEKQSEVKKN